MLCPNKVYYLATPYSSTDQHIVEERYDSQQWILAYLTKDLGLLVIAPIEMCHNLGKKFDLPSGYEYWKKRDRTLIERSDGIIVGMLDGWQQSIGVTDEIAHARQLKKEVYFLNPHTLYISLDSEMMDGTVK